MGRACAQDPQGWKRPWGLFGVGLRLKTQKGHRHVPHPWSQRAGDLTWEPSRLPGLLWAGQLPSASLLLLLDGSSHLPLLMSSASLLCPQDPCGLDGALEWGYWSGSSAGSPAREGQATALRSSPALPGESLPPASPDLPGLRGADPVQPPLLLPPQSPYVLPVHSGVPPVSLGIRVPHQWLAHALVVGRLTPCLPTPPS